VSDNNAYLRFNRDPVDKMITHLREYFDPKTPEPGFSLGITVGMGGARLSHNHERQYAYVMQVRSIQKFFTQAPPGFNI